MKVLRSIKFSITNSSQDFMLRYLHNFYTCGVTPPSPAFTVCEALFRTLLLALRRKYPYGAGTAGWRYCSAEPHILSLPACLNGVRRTAQSRIPQGEGREGSAEQKNICRTA